MEEGVHLFGTCCNAPLTDRERSEVHFVGTGVAGGKLKSTAARARQSENSEKCKLPLSTFQRFQNIHLLILLLGGDSTA